MEGVPKKKARIDTETATAAAIAHSAITTELAKSDEKDHLGKVASQKRHMVFSINDYTDTEPLQAMSDLRADCAAREVTIDAFPISSSASSPTKNAHSKVLRQMDVYFVRHGQGFHNMLAGL